MDALGVVHFRTARPGDGSKSLWIMGAGRARLCESRRQVIPQCLTTRGKKGKSKRKGKGPKWIEHEGGHREYESERANEQTKYRLRTGRARRLLREVFRPEISCKEKAVAYAPRCLDTALHV